MQVVAQVDILVQLHQSLAVQEAVVIVLADLMEMVMLELPTLEVVEVLLNVRVAVAQEMVVLEDLALLFFVILIPKH